MHEIAQGYCTNHPEPIQKIQDPTGENVCILCQGKRQILTGPVVATGDPGEDKLSMMLRQAGVPVGKSRPIEERTAPVAAPARAQTVALKSPVSLDLVLAQLKALPMPASMKHFKAIQKAIKSLESIKEESNG